VEFIIFRGNLIKLDLQFFGDNVLGNASMWQHIVRQTFERTIIIESSSGYLVLFLFFWLSCSGYLVLVILYWLFLYLLCVILFVFTLCLSCSCYLISNCDCLVLFVLYWLSFSFILFWFSCSGYSVLAIFFWISHSGYHAIFYRAYIYLCDCENYHLLSQCLFLLFWMLIY